MSRGNFPVGRRLLIAGSVGTAAALTGCDLLPDTSSPTPMSPSPTPLAGDDLLTERTTTALAEATALAELVARRFGGLRTLAGPFAALHRSHARMLGGLPTVDPPQVRRPQARRVLLAREERLQQQLVEAALAAESGALAQAFAAMAAAVAQRRAAIR